MEMITYKIKGVTPLLMNNPSAMLEAVPTAMTKAVKHYPKEEEAEKKAYRDKKGYYIPAISFRSAILTATTGKKIGKEKAIFVIPSSVHLCEENSYLLDKNNKLIKDYTIDSRRAVVNKAGIIRHRPRFEDWSCDLVLKIDTERIDPEIVLQLLNEAGEKVGVGDFRPQKKGWFGLFTAEMP